MVSTEVSVESDRSRSANSAAGIAARQLGQEGAAPLCSAVASHLDMQFRCTGSPQHRVAMLGLPCSSSQQMQHVSACSDRRCSCIAWSRAAETDATHDRSNSCHAHPVCARSSLHIASPQSPTRACGLQTAARTAATNELRCALDAQSTIGNGSPSSVRIRDSTSRESRPFPSVNGWTSRIPRATAAATASALIAAGPATAARACTTNSAAEARHCSRVACTFMHAESISIVKDVHTKNSQMINIYDDSVVGGCIWVPHPTYI